MRLIEHVCDAGLGALLVSVDELMDGGERPVEGAEEDGGALGGVHVLPGSIDLVQVFVFEMFF